MYFIASKIAWFLLQPSLLLITAPIIGAGLLLTRFERGGRAIAIVGGCALAVFAMSPVSVFLIRPLEDRYPVPNLSEIPRPSGIIVLGGALNGRITQGHALTSIPQGESIAGPIALNSSGSRVTEGLRLALRFPEAKLVFTGGAGALIRNEIPEADVAREFFLSLGLPPQRLFIERQSRNTIENANFTRELINPEVGSSWLLVTSASHMRRAVGVFENAGFSVIPYPVDFSVAGDGSEYWDHVFAPVENLQLLDRATKEWIGLFAYNVFGRLNRRAILEALHWRGSLETSGDGEPRDPHPHPR